MKTFQVFDYNFNVVGVIEADDATMALQLAKRRWKFVPGLMVQEA